MYYYRIDGGNFERETKNQRPVFAYNCKWLRIAEFSFESINFSNVRARELRKLYGKVTLIFTTRPRGQS